MRIQPLCHLSIQALSLWQPYIYSTKRVGLSNDIARFVATNFLKRENRFYRVTKAVKFFRYISRFYGTAPAFRVYGADRE